MGLSELNASDLFELIEAYNEYIEDANENDLYSTGWKPVCIEEFYNNEFQER